MLSLSVLFEIVILLTSVCGLIVGAWLNWRARGQQDLKALSGFAIMMSLWCCGHLALAHDYYEIGIFLILANPLMPTFFLEFSVRFVGSQFLQTSRQTDRQTKAHTTNPPSPLLSKRYRKTIESWITFLSRHLYSFYFVSVIVAVISWLLDGGTTIEKSGMSLFLYTSGGWFNLIYTIAIGILAHAVLLYGWCIHEGNKRRSILGLFMVSTWGLLLATSFIFPSVGVDIFPYPMLLLPSYLLLLVYAVVRYQMLAVNAFANRALLWLAMMVILLSVIASISAMSGRLGLQALADVPAWQLWIYSVAVLVFSVLIYQPLSHLIEKLVYPGSRLNEALLDKWSATLAQAKDWPQLTRYGESLLSAQLGSNVIVSIVLDKSLDAIVSGKSLGTIAEEKQATETRHPQLIVTQTRGNWRFELQSWHDVTPGMRLAGEVFGSLFATRCGLLEQSLELADAERIRLDEQHLVELGGLSASMAHELRNPLNIISMASMKTDDSTKKHIQTQVQRADRLIKDMLVYSGSIQLHYTEVPLRSLLDSLVSQTELERVDVSINIANDLIISADVHRLQQVFINLLDNAASFLRNQTDSQLMLEASVQTPNGQQTEWVRIRFHNNGPALSPELSKTGLFRPFVSKRAGGSGLGLAIVRRILDAHQGRISFRDDLGWPVSFEIELPLSNVPHLKQFPTKKDV